MNNIDIKKFQKLDNVKWYCIQLYAIAFVFEIL